MVDFKQTIGFLKAALNATEDLIFVKDRDFYYRAVNKPVCDNYLMTEDQIVGFRDDELLPPETVSIFRPIDKEVINTGRRIKVEEWVTFPSGKRVLLETVKSPCFDDEGNIIGLIGVARDISVRKKAEEELKLAKEEADHASQAKSQFLSNMSHEIRTPMNAVLGFSQILQELEEDASKKFYLESILNAGKNLLSIINDILDLSKVEAGQFELQYTPVSLERLLEELNLFFLPKISEKGLNFSVSNVKMEKAILVDAVRLRQVLINIINNAVKFTVKGFISVAVEFEYLNEFKNIGKVKITVKDSGIGIDLNQQDRIFETFLQAKGQRTSEYGGTGLGLAISKQLMELMGGDITLDSEKGAGSTFYIELPEVEMVELGSLSGNDDGIDIKDIVFEPATIVIADDINYNRDVLKGFLKEYNFKLVEAGDGKELLKVLKETKADLILLDVKMPEVTGLEAAQIIKLDRNVPIVAVTAFAMDEEQKKISKYTDGYLRKPVVKRELVLELMEHLKYKNSNS